MEDFIINSAFVGSQTGVDKGSSSGEGTSEAGSEDFLGILKNLMYGKNSQKNVPKEMDGPVNPGSLDLKGLKGLLMSSVGSVFADAMKGGVPKGEAPVGYEGENENTAGEKKAAGIELHYDQIAFQDSQAILAATTPAPDVAGDQGGSRTRIQDTEMGMSNSSMSDSGTPDSIAPQAAFDRGEALKYLMMLLQDSQTILAATTPAPDVAGDQGASQTRIQDTEMGMSNSSMSDSGTPDSIAPQAAFDRGEALKYLMMLLQDSQAILAATTPAPDVAGDQGASRTRIQDTEMGMSNSSMSDSGTPDSITPQAAFDRANTASQPFKQENIQSESMPMSGNGFAVLLGQRPLNSVMALLADRMSSGEEPKTEIEVMKGQSKTALSQEELIKESMEKNTQAARSTEEQGGQTGNWNGMTGGGAGKGKGQDHGGAVPHNQTGGQKVTDSTFVYDIEVKETLAGDRSQTSDVFMRNAVKKYEMFVEDKDTTKDKADTESVDGLFTNKGMEISQGDNSKTNVHQTREDGRVFEKGSFSSFITDRVEKVVEQYATRNSSMDTVVRLKLDDKETLTVGFKHEGQNVVVEVKASNEGLANLLQSHKEDITRHLEDKNIFARMYVEADGENAFERQNQRQNKREDERKEGETSFTAVLEAIA
ncbi:MAG: hypothetical protein A4E62_02618 [Syntrophorhabdus sp. PtaU1.Bin002]|nr:MAG: hypothetical protein A4E62_02618 [Syntrophorhabdus sp. PtaU1.Bin002]